MSRRVIIIGAGFSKALAEAPLVNEFAGTIYNNCINKEISKKIGKTDFEESFIKVLEYLTNSIEHGLKLLEKDGSQIRNRFGEDQISSLNIEHICTLIDLNIKRPFIPKGIGIDLQSCPIPYMKNMFVHNFEDAQKLINHYIIKMLLPDSLNINLKLLSSFINFIEPGDVLITFNYDLLIEQTLWQAKLWQF